MTTPSYEDCRDAVARCVPTDPPMPAAWVLYREEILTLLHAARIGLRVMEPGARERVLRVLMNKDARTLWDNADAETRRLMLEGNPALCATADAILALFTEPTP